jgi:tight adherence protein B
VRQVAILAIDNSKSMGPSGKLAAAQTAAKTFLQGVPADVEVGLVTFGSTATVQLEPTIDRSQLGAKIDALQIDETTGTALFDAARQATEETGDADTREVVLLTDGNDYGQQTTTLEDATAVVRAANVTLDAVFIGDGSPPDELTRLAQASQTGSVSPASVETVQAIFRRFAQAITTQLIINADVPDTVASAGNIVVSVDAGGSPLRATSLWQRTGGGGGGAAGDYGPKPVPNSSLPVLSDTALPIMLGALFVGLLLIAYVAVSAFRRDEKHGRVRRRLSVYSLTGRHPVKQQETTTALGSSQVARSAVELAGKVAQKRDFEDDLALRLEAAGVPLRAAEWMLIHVGVAIGAALLLLLISGGQLLPTLVGLVIGLALPWAYLTVKESRRTSAFLAQLPDTLQLLAGSLSAGYSMPQAMDTVVREGQQPITGEFNRALVESRLGVPIEDALDGIAERMKSKDFAWVVMAIKIQREVGGNLAELLTTVSGTLRERERLRRQVQVLSAEGRLSAWILGLLPIVFAMYLALVRPSYLQPLVSETLGWLLIGLGVALLVVGVLWLRKAVKVEV